MARRRRRTVAQHQDDAATSDPLAGWTPPSTMAPSSRLGLRPPLRRRRPASTTSAARSRTARTAKPVAQRSFPLYSPALRQWPRLEAGDRKRRRRNSPDPARFYLSPAHALVTRGLVQVGATVGMLLAGVGARFGMPVGPYALAVPIGAATGGIVGYLRHRDASAIRLELDAEEIEIYSHDECWLDCAWDELESVRMTEEGDHVRLRLSVASRSAFVDAHPEAGQLRWEEESMLIEFTGTDKLLNQLDGALMSYLPRGYRGLAG